MKQIIDWLSAHPWACIILYLLIGLALTGLLVVLDRKSEDDTDETIGLMIFFWPIGMLLILIVVCFAILPELLIKKLKEEIKNR